MTVIALLPNRNIPVETVREALPEEEVLDAATAAPDLLRRTEVMIGSPQSQGIERALETAPGLRWFSSMSAGADRLAELGLVGERSRVVVTLNRGVHDVPMADHVMALIYAAARNLHRYGRQQSARQWVRLRAQVEIRDTTLVVYGLGSIGTELARVAAAAGMRVIGVKRSPGSVPPGVERCVAPEHFGDVAAEADYLAVCAPLTPETKHAINASLLARMRQTAWVINIARGELVDEPALVDALRAGTIGGAALDVVQKEPLAADSPLWGLDNVIITPHSAITSPHMPARTMRLFRENLARFKRGEPLANVVDHRRGY